MMKSEVLDGLTKEWWFGLFRVVNQRSETDTNPLEYEDYMVYPIRSLELERTYSCFHVVGPDLDFIFKESDENEAELYRILNDCRITPRLSVPKTYKRIKITHPATGDYIVYLAMEHIAVAPGIGLTDCSDQVDGLLMYKDGQSVEAWASAGYELARICYSFWNAIPLEGVPYHGKSYEVLLSEILASRRIRIDKKLNAAAEKAAGRLNRMPRCLQNLDLFPINVMIKERAYSTNGRQVIRPNAFIVDWKNAMPAPYTLDLARIISHCYREVVIDESVQIYSNKYCPIRCEEAVKNSFLSELKKRITGIQTAEFEKDLLCGEFFEIARMYIQMPTDQPHDSYDRYYCSCMQQLAERVLSEI